jgi:hypothetical protein
VNEGVNTTYSYNDSLERLTQVIRGQGDSLENQTNVTYSGDSREVNVYRDQNTNGDRALRTQMLYDGLGRLTEPRTYESGSQYITTVTTYDALGRTHSVTNPYRPGDAVPTTTYGYNALGRENGVQRPDGSTATTSYSGAFSTMTDETGRVKKYQSKRVEVFRPVRTNSRMEGLIRECNPRPRTLTGQLQKILGDGLTYDDGCLVLKSQLRLAQPDRGEFQDETGYECFVNHIHLEDILASADRCILLEQALAFAEELAALRSRAGLSEPIEYIIIGDEDEINVRFHISRPGQSWLVDDLETYAEAVASILLSSCADPDAQTGQLEGTR